MGRPTFANRLPATVQDVALSGSTHTLTAGELSALLVSGQLALDLEVLPTTDTYLQTGAQGTAFELTSSTAGSISLQWNPVSSPATAASFWALNVGGSMIIQAKDQQNGAPYNASGAAPAAGQRFRIIVALVPSCGYALLQFVVNGIASVPLTTSFSTALGTISAGRLGSMVDTSLPYACTLSRLRSHHYVVATAAWLPVLVFGGDSIESTIAQGQGNAPSTMIYTAAEAAAMDLPRGLNISKPGGTILDQNTDLAASFASTCGTVQAFTHIVGVNDAVSGDTSATMLGDAGTLLATIRSGVPQAKAVFGQVTPARTYASMGDVKWAEVVTYNAGLSGLGADLVMTSHYAALDDGTGALKAAADSGDHIHPVTGIAGDPAHPGRVDIAAAERAQLLALGLL